MTGETTAELRARLAMAPVFSRHKSTEWVALAVTDRDAIDGMLAHLVVVEAERDRLKQVQRHYGSTTWQDHLTSALEENEELLARLAAAEAQLQSIFDASVLFAEKVPDGLLPLFKAVVAVASQRWLAEHPT